MATLGELIVKIGADAKGFTKAMRESQKQIKITAKGFDSAGKKMQAIGGNMSKYVTLPILAISAAFYKVAQDAAKFDNQMREVFTLLPDLTKQEMDKMGDQVLEFSKKFGVLPEKVVPALYQAISAGVPKENVFDFLEIATKASIGGVTELETAVDGITSVTNAYGTDVINAKQASDLMFTAVKQGKTDFDQLSRSLFNVIPTAAALGVKFGDVTAGLASLTAQGTPTSVATTQMRQMFVELSKEGSGAALTFKRLSGVSLREFIGSGKNTQDALNLMEKEAEKLNIGVNDLFGSVEAGNAALGLTGKGTEMFTKNLKEMDSAAGTTQKAFDTMDESVARQFEKLIVEMDSLKIELGRELLPVINDVLIPAFKDSLPAIKSVVEVVADLIKSFSDLPKPMQGMILKGLLLLVVLGPMSSTVGGLIRGFKNLAGPILKIARKFGLFKGGADVASSALGAGGLKGKLGPVEGGLSSLGIRGFLPFLGYAGVFALFATGVFAISKAMTNKFIPALAETRRQLDPTLTMFESMEGIGMPGAAQAFMPEWQKQQMGLAKTELEKKQDILNRELMGFAGGGIIPGPIGSPQLAVVHGGEEVLTPAQQRSSNYLEVGGTILVKGVNSMGELIGVAKITGQQIASQISRDDRRLPNRVSLIPF